MAFVPDPKASRASGGQGPFVPIISLLFARVINLIIVIVIVNNICIVMVRIYNFVENKGIFQ